MVEGFVCVTVFVLTALPVKVTGGDCQEMLKPPLWLGAKLEELSEPGWRLVEVCIHGQILNCFSISIGGHPL